MFSVNEIWRKSGFQKLIHPLFDLENFEILLFIVIVCTCS